MGPFLDINLEIRGDLLLDLMGTRRSSRSRGKTVRSPGRLRARGGTEEELYTRVSVEQDFLILQISEGHP